MLLLLLLVKAAETDLLVTHVSGEHECVADIKLNGPLL